MCIECVVAVDVQTNDSSSGVVSDEQCVISDSHWSASSSPQSVYVIPTTLLPTSHNNAVCPLILR